MCSVDWAEAEQGGDDATRLGQMPTGEGVRVSPHCFLPTQSVQSHFWALTFSTPSTDSLFDALIFSLHAMTSRTLWDIFFCFSSPSSCLETDLKYSITNQTGHFFLLFSTSVHLFQCLIYKTNDRKDHSPSFSLRHYFI